MSLNKSASEIAMDLIEWDKRLVGLRADYSASGMRLEEWWRTVDDNRRAMEQETGRQIIAPLPIHPAFADPEQIARNVKQLVEEARVFKAKRSMMKEISSEDL
ncbi:hypothetical protein BH10PLA2_BH10PLA2_27450 [soil metagenome]